MRRGIAELNGEGETVGGIVVVRYGANAYKVIQDVKQRLDQAMKALPADVKVTVTYDRTALIDRAVKTLEEKLIEESIVVALVCLAFLLHLRSALVAIIILPVAVLISFLVMFGQGISSNIMSLGGIAIAIGAMVDAVIIMIENAHKHLERDQGKKPHWEIIRDAAVEVGPALFYSLLVITVSFLPVFTLQEQEGRLFKPLAFTKTYSMAAAALLSITLAPVLMGWFIRGKIPKEEKNPINRFLIWLYHPGCGLGYPVCAGWWWSAADWSLAGCFSRGTRSWRMCCRKAACRNWLSPPEIVSISKHRLGIHAAALRGRFALHAHDVSGHFADQGARIGSSHRPHHQIVSRSRNCFRQGRPRRNRHRSRADGHD